MDKTEPNKSQKGLRKAALEYHSKGRKGKIEVVSAKPCLTQHDLSMAYTPGVAVPCLEIQKNPSKAREYTAKGNLVAVISNGTAVLGLGNIGALAGKPVMEGKGVLFKRFADIDVFDIELDTEDPDEIIRTVKNLAPTFGGINLEDIKAPECFYIEETLKKELDIPVFHDDQHGTAIISGAALINALELVEKDISKIKLVVSGAGAAGIACTNFYISLGVSPENILMVDSKGVLWKGRGDEGKNKYKDKYFRDTPARSLADAMIGADVFCGVSIKGILTKDMAKTMADRPIIFAMANPDPEITFPDAIEARPDAIVATGRSDYPNQVNNVLGFPFIFRGTLDVESTHINEEMKLATAFALAKLAKEEVPEKVKLAYDDLDLSFGPEYIIPKPFDARVLTWAASAVAKAAMKTGVAKKYINIEEYKEELRERLDQSREVMRKFHLMARRDPRRIVFPEGTHPKIIWASSEIARMGIAKPVLLGKSKNEILQLFEEHHHSPKGIEILEPKYSGLREDYENIYYKLRQRKGVVKSTATLQMRNYFYFATMMVHQGFVDGMIGGVSVGYPDILHPALEIIGLRKGGSLVAGMYFVLHNHQFFAFTDCSVNVNPNASQLAEIALMAATELEHFRIEPRIAMVSFSNFGSVRCSETDKITEAVALVKSKRPEIIVDGPVQADAALDMKFLEKHFPFTTIKKRPNILVFPNLDAGNISLKLLKKFSKANTIGPLMMGMAKPIHLIPRGAEVNSIINLTAIACVDAQKTKNKKVEQLAF